MRTACRGLLTLLVFVAVLAPPAVGAASRSYVDHKVPSGSPPLPFSDAVLSGDTYRTYFHGHYPARAFIGSDKLLRGAHFEVQGMATRETR